MEKRKKSQVINVGFFIGKRMPIFKHRSLKHFDSEDVIKEKTFKTFYR